MTERTSITNQDTDFEEFHIFINGALQRPELVVSANSATGEVWRYAVGSDGYIAPKGRKVTKKRVNVGTARAPEYEMQDEDGGEEDDHPRELATGTVRIMPILKPE